MSARDVILFQRISGGWVYEYTRDGETYRGGITTRTRLEAACGAGWAGTGGDSMLPIFGVFSA